MCLYSSLPSPTFYSRESIASLHCSTPTLPLFYCHSTTSLLSLYRYSTIILSSFYGQSTTILLSDYRQSAASRRSVYHQSTAILLWISESARSLSMKIYRNTGNSKQKCFAINWFQFDDRSVLGDEANHWTWPQILIVIMSNHAASIFVSMWMNTCKHWNGSSEPKTYTSVDAVVVSCALLLVYRFIGIVVFY